MQKVLSLVTAALVTVSAHGAAQVRRDQPAAAATKPRTGYVLANGINYYYEIHGQGAPLLLLYEIAMSPALVPTVLPFLDGK